MLVHVSTFICMQLPNDGQLKYFRRPVFFSVQGMSFKAWCVCLLIISELMSYILCKVKQTFLVYFLSLDYFYDCENVF